MRFNAFISIRAGKLKIAGLLGMAILIGLFSLPNLIAASPDSVTAEKWIRSYLKQQVLNEGVNELRGESVSTKHHGLAVSWKQNLDQIEEMEFTEIEIKHFLVAPPTSSTRIFIVRAVMRDSFDHEQTRYFSLNAINKFYDFFWVAEQPLWMWYFSV